MNNKTIVTLLGLVGWAALGACSSGDDRPPLSGDHPLRTDGGSSSSSSGGSSGSSSGGTGEDGAAPTDGGAPTDATIYDGPVSPPTDAAMISPTCSPNQTWGTPTDVAGLPTFVAQPLVTITNDELTIAWVVDDGNGQASVYYADRTSTTAPFGSATELMPHGAGGSMYYVDGSLVSDGGDAYFAFDRVSLSSDGLKLIGVTVGSLKMGEFDRQNRTSAFGADPQESAYSQLTSVLMAGEKLGDPVLSPDGKELVYSRYGLSTTQTIYDSFLTAGAVWPGGSGEDLAALASTIGQRKHPTSMTADRLALFVWDESGQASAVLRASPTSQFNYPISLGSKFSIQVNGDCSRIYFVASNGASGYVVQQTDSN
jgi:hypothetical protein